MTGNPEGLGSRDAKALCGARLLPSVYHLLSPFLPTAQSPACFAESAERGVVNERGCPQSRQEERARFRRKGPVALLELTRCPRVPFTRQGVSSSPLSKLPRGARWATHEPKRPEIHYRRARSALQPQRRTAPLQNALKRGWEVPHQDPTLLAGGVEPLPPSLPASSPPPSPSTCIVPVPAPGGVTGPPMRRPCSPCRLSISPASATAVLRWQGADCRPCVTPAGVWPAAAWPAAAPPACVSSPARPIRVQNEACRSVCCLWRLKGLGGDLTR